MHRVTQHAADAAQPDDVVGRQERQDVVQDRVLRGTGRPVLRGTCLNGRPRIRQADLRRYVD